MSKNEGKFLSREEEIFKNGDRAITDTFILEDGSQVYHLYNITSDNKEHSHQIMDEDGNHIEARAIVPRKWIELDR